MTDGACIHSAAIVGAGIGGLTSAIALARRGIAVDVYEQAPALTEIGAGKYLVSGGSNDLVNVGAPTDSAEVYTANSGGGSWSSAGTLSTARALHAAYRFGNRVIAIGGAGGDLSAPVGLASTEYYDIGNNSMTNA